MSSTSALAFAGDDLFADAGAVPATRLGDALIARITDAIRDGRLKPGDALPSEARIAAGFGVSKPVAREALRQLAAMGVVHVQQGKATRITALNAQPLDRFFRFAVGGTRQGLVQAVELRRILEPPIAAYSAQRRSEVDVADLEDILVRMEGSLGNGSGWIEADLAFHAKIAASSGNRLLELQMEGLMPVIREVMEIFDYRSSRSLADWRKTYERHAKVVEAIKAGDAAAAQLAMTKHFEAAEAAIAELATIGEEKHVNQHRTSS